MASFNKCFLMGNLTRDPELRYTPSGAAVADIGLAVNNAYKTKSGEKREEVLFIKCVAWGKTAEVVAEYLKKGSSCFIEGRLKPNDWEDKEGKKRHEIDVVVETVKFLGGGKGASGTGNAKPAQAAPGEIHSGGEGEDEVPF